MKLIFKHLKRVLKSLMYLIEIPPFCSKNLFCGFRPNYKQLRRSLQHPSEELSDKIYTLFNPEYFPSAKRGHELLDKAAFFIVISYWFISFYSMFLLAPAGG
jgi:hypothetical protein